VLVESRKHQTRWRCIGQRRGHSAGEDGNADRRLCWFGESVRRRSRTTVNYGRWLRIGYTAELVRAVGRSSYKRALIKCNGRSIRGRRGG
jgi:hypothetical protein